MDKIWGHIETINDEMGNIKSDIAVQKNNLKWIKWIVGIILLDLIGITIGVIKLLIGI